MLRTAIPCDLLLTLFPDAIYPNLSSLSYCVVPIELYRRSSSAHVSPDIVISTFPTAPTLTNARILALYSFSQRRTVILRCWDSHSGNSNVSGITSRVVAIASSVHVRGIFRLHQHPSRDSLQRIIHATPQ